MLAQIDMSVNTFVYIMLVLSCIACVYICAVTCIRVLGHSELKLHACEFQVYICELGRCLLKLKDSSDAALEVRMRELTIEAISLVGHRLLRNPATHKDLATGQMNRDQAAQHVLDANFYKNLLVRHSMQLAADLSCLALL